MAKVKANPTTTSISAAAATVVLVFLCCFATIAEGEKLENFGQTFGSFNDTSKKDLKLIGPATINGNALQVTPDSGNGGFNLTRNNSGRVLLDKRFKLWEDGIQPNTRIASFHTSFLINIYGDNGSVAGGLAFVIVPDLHLPDKSSGQYLGLTNSSTNGNATNQVVAVELDTFKQDFDPDDNHVGIDINSVKSIKNESLSRHNITLASTGNDLKFYNVWVDYNGTSKIMQVYIAQQATQTGSTPPKPASTPPKPASPLLSADLNSHLLANFICIHLGTIA